MATDARATRVEETWCGILDQHDKQRRGYAVVKERICLSRSGTDPSTPEMDEGGMFGGTNRPLRDTVQSEATTLRDLPERSAQRTKALSFGRESSTAIVIFPRFRSNKGDPGRCRHPVGRPPRQATNPGPTPPGESSENRLVRGSMPSRTVDGRFHPDSSRCHPPWENTCDRGSLLSPSAFLFGPLLWLFLPGTVHSVLQTTPPRISRGPMRVHHSGTSTVRYAPPWWWETGVHTLTGVDGEQPRAMDVHSPIQWRCQRTQQVDANTRVGIPCLESKRTRSK